MSILSISAARLRTDRTLRWKHVKRRIRERWHLIQSRYELESLSDEGLRDIGLSRAEADFEAPKPFWKDRSPPGATIFAPSATPLKCGRPKPIGKLPV